MKEIEEKIEKTHQSSWHRYAGFTSTLSLVLPVLSEFEGAIAENFIFAIGGTGAMSVFAIMMKLGRVASILPEIEHEHGNHLKEEADSNREKIVKERQRRLDSDYLPDY